MRRWVRYEAPVMVCVDIDEAGGDGDIINVVLGNDTDDIHLSRDHRGGFLVYDNDMERIEDGDDEGTAVSIAERRGEWPDRLQWEEGPDALRFPGLYDIDDDTADDDEDEDLEPFDLDETDKTSRPPQRS